MPGSEPESLELEAEPPGFDFISLIGLAIGLIYTPLLAVFLTGTLLIAWNAGSILVAGFAALGLAVSSVPLALIGEAVRRALRKRRMTIVDQRLLVNSPLDPGILFPKQVEITGEVGQPIAITVIGRRRYQVTRTVPSTAVGWTYPRLKGLAEDLAERLQVPLADRLDHDLWSRWHEDPAFRARLQFDLTLARNARLHKRWHDASPLEPHELVYDHHGLSTPHLTIDPTGVADGNKTIPLQTILSVGVRFTSSSGALLLLTTDGVVRLAPRTVRHHVDAGELLGVSRLVWSQVTEARTAEDRGSESDIPHGLGALRAQKGTDD